MSNSLTVSLSLRRQHQQLKRSVARHENEVTSTGNLHSRSAAYDNGFSEETIPLHVVDGIGDLLGWLRALVTRPQCVAAGRR